MFTNQNLTIEQVLLEYPTWMTENNINKSFVFYKNVKKIKQKIFLTFIQNKTS